MSNRTSVLELVGNTPLISLDGIVIIYRKGAIAGKS